MATTDDINAALRVAQLAAQQAQTAAASARATAVTINQMAATALFWAGTWSANVYYGKYAVVVLSDVLYTSLQDANKGHSPDSSPSQWQAFGAAGGAPAPSSTIHGLDFTTIEGVPTLRETPSQIVDFAQGLSAGETSDDSAPMLAVAPGQFSVNLGPEDSLFLGTGDMNVVMNSSGEVDIFGQVLQLSSNSDLFLVGNDLTITGNSSIDMTSNTAININTGGGGTVTLGEAGDTMVIGGIHVTDGEIDIFSQTINVGGNGGAGTVNIGQGNGDNINVATNAEDSFNVGLTSDASARMMVIESGLASFNLGPDDEFSLATVDFVTRLDIRAGQILLQAGGTLSLGESSDVISFFGVSAVGQQSGGDLDASDTYGLTEQTMLNSLWQAQRAYGLLS
jgi:hypothetical protein